ncbi:hypothetical protein TIFTF001_015137 [Ficus carica]|uniref:Uncharacterized protein n=1 Tax=Ficus carica TaxID=3494 RepID=A0AA88A545_FICCA|nr:hypothetical protein TIFTF001_015137 [Ficus carica]
MSVDQGRGAYLVRVYLTKVTSIFYWVVRPVIVSLIIRNCGFSESINFIKGQVQSNTTGTSVMSWKAERFLTLSENQVSLTRKAHLQTALISDLSTPMSRKLALKSCKFEGIEVWQQSVPHMSSGLLQTDEHPATIAASIPHPTAANTFTWENTKGLHSNANNFKPFVDVTPRSGSERKRNADVSAILLTVFLHHRCFRYCGNDKA